MSFFRSIRVSRIPYVFLYVPWNLLRSVVIFSVSDESFSFFTELLRPNWIFASLLNPLHLFFIFFSLSICFCVVRYDLFSFHMNLSESFPFEMGLLRSIWALASTGEPMRALESFGEVQNSKRV